MDPGYKETGLVLRQGTKILEYALFKDEVGRGERTVYRSTALASRITAIVNSWVASYNIRHLEVGLERPIYNRHTITFEKQISLFYFIEAELIGLADGYCAYWVTEFIPSESKYAATGNGAASKAEVLAASPFKPDLALMEQDSWETLGDAWAASLMAGMPNHEGRFRLE